MLEKDMWKILKKSLRNRDDIKLYRLENSVGRGIPDIVFHYQINSCWVTGWIESKELFKGAKTDAWLYDYISIGACHVSIEQLEFLLRAPNSYLYLSFPDGRLKLIPYLQLAEMCLNSSICWRDFLDSFVYAPAKENDQGYLLGQIHAGSMTYVRNSMLRFALSDE